jgi:hypothetical protein
VQGALLPGWIGATVALLLLIASAYIQFRHIGLALIAVIAPLPGYAAAMALPISAQPLAYLCGFSAAVILMSAVELKVCEGASASDAGKQATGTWYPILFWPLALALCVSAVVPLVTRDVPALMLPLTVLLCVASAMILGPLAARSIPYGEEFIAGANRMREKRERRLDLLTFSVQPRWGWSVAGIALIFAVLGFFGGEHSIARWSFGSPIALPIMGATFVAVAYMATRNIRYAIAALLAVAVLACIAFGLSGRLPGDGNALPLAAALALLPALLIGGQSAIFARAGDTVAVAILRSFELLTVPTVFFCAAAMLVLCVFGAFASAVLILCGGVAGLIVVPALTTAIYDLFPPRVSLDAYRIR